MIILLSNIIISNMIYIIVSNMIYINVITV